MVPAWCAKPSSRPVPSRRLVSSRLASPRVASRLLVAGKVPSFQTQSSPSPQNPRLEYPCSCSCIRFRHLGSFSLTTPPLHCISLQHAPPGRVTLFCCFLLSACELVPVCQLTPWLEPCADVQRFAPNSSATRRIPRATTARSRSESALATIPSSSSSSKGPPLSSPPPTALTSLLLRPPPARPPPRPPPRPQPLPTPPTRRPY